LSSHRKNHSLCYCFRLYCYVSYGETSPCAE